MKFTDPNYYVYLQIDIHAEAEVIEAAYKRLVKKYHPDSNNGDKAREEKLKQINVAYEVLSDPIKRKTYDFWLHTYKKQQDTKQNQQNTKSSKHKVDIDYDEIHRKASEEYQRWQNNSHASSNRTYKRQFAKKILPLFCIFSAAIAVFGFVFYTKLDSPVSLHGTSSMMHTARKIIDNITDGISTISGVDIVNAVDHTSEPTEQTVSSNDKESANLANAEIQTEKETDELKSDKDTEDVFYYRVDTQSSLNVRTNASSESEIITKLSSGTICQSNGNLSDDGKWMEILIPNSTQNGWVATAYLQPVSNYEGDQSANNTKVYSVSDNYGLTIFFEELNGNHLRLSYKNDSAKIYSLGWVEHTRITVKTDVGEYGAAIDSGFMAEQIESNSTGEITATFNELEGTVQSITLDPVYLLDSRGLPGFGDASLTIYMN